jgi:hypothetical protein
VPKKPFSFDVSRRKLFDSERKAVEAFVRKYSFVSSAEPRSHSLAKPSRPEVESKLANVPGATIKSGTQPGQLKMARASERKSMAEKKARILAIKVAIFGAAAQPSKKE